MALYFDATRAASIIATQTTGEDLRKARDTFQALYHGEMCIVEDQKVIDAMITMKGLIDDLDEAPPEGRAAACAALRNGSIDLAHACRSSIKDTWDVELKELDDRSAKKNK